MMCNAIFLRTVKRVLFLNILYDGNIYMHVKGAILHSPLFLLFVGYFGTFVQM